MERAGKTTLGRVIAPSSESDHIDCQSSPDRTAQLLVERLARRKTEGCSTLRIEEFSYLRDNQEQENLLRGAYQMGFKTLVIEAQFPVFNRSEMEKLTLSLGVELKVVSVVPRGENLDQALKNYIRAYLETAGVGNNEFVMEEDFVIALAGASGFHPYLVNCLLGEYFNHLARLSSTKVTLGTADFNKFVGNEFWNTDIGKGLIGRHFDRFFTRKLNQRQRELILTFLRDGSLKQEDLKDLSPLEEIGYFEIVGDQPRLTIGLFGNWLRRDYPPSQQVRE